MAIFYGLYWFFCVEKKISLSWQNIFWIGFAARICALAIPVCDDIYRYIWEGKILGLGWNPYHYAPTANELVPYQDRTWPLINHPSFPAIYPPLIQGLFAILAKISVTPFFFKTVFMVFDLTVFFLMKKIIEPETKEIKSTFKLAIYFLNPLLIFEIAGRGHFESISIFFNLVFFWILIKESRLKPKALSKTFNRLGLYGSLLAGALVKINSLILFPLIWFGKPFTLNLEQKANSKFSPHYNWDFVWNLVWTFIFGLILLSSLYVTGAGNNLLRFSDSLTYNSAMPFFLSKIFFFTSKNFIHLINFMLFAAAGLYFFFVPKRNLAEQALVFMGLFLLFSPTLHPWYLLWILPFAALAESKPWLLFCGTVLFSYAVYASIEPGGEFIENHWLRILEFLPPLILWWLSLRRERLKN